MNKWRPIINYETLYGINLLGSIRNTKSYRILKWHYNNKGYPRVSLCRGGVCKRHFVHRLVMENFVGKCPQGEEVNHKDFNVANPSLANLEYVTRSNNIRHTYRFKDYPLRGEAHPSHKLSENAVKFIRQSNATLRELAGQFAVCHKTILNIKQRRKWEHVLSPPRLG